MTRLSRISRVLHIPGSSRISRRAGASRRSRSSHSSDGSGPSRVTRRPPIAHSSRIARISCKSRGSRGAHASGFTERTILASLVAAMVAMAMPAPAWAQQTGGLLWGEAAMGPVVRGAPYSGDGRVTVDHRLGDGTQITRSIDSKSFRDSTGRVRREQTVLGLAALDPMRESVAVVIIADPVAGVVYSLDPATRVAQRMPIDPRMLAETPPPPPPPPPASLPSKRMAPPPPPPPAAPPQSQEEPLGTRQMDGMTVTGRRTRMTIPTGQMGNDRPIEITDERWESPELKVVVRSRHHDPRTGTIEFRLTNISRAEPPPELFTVPSDYSIVEAPPPPRPPPPPPAAPRPPR